MIDERALKVCELTVSQAKSIDINVILLFYAAITQSAIVN